MPTHHARTPRRRTSALAAILVGVLALAATACGSSDGSTDTASSGAESTGEVTIVATTSILGDVVANVVGDLATVEVLMPAGTDPHDFEPSAQQAAELRNADLIVVNGLMLEEGLLEPIETAEADGVPVLEVAPAVDPLPAEGKDHSDEAGHSEEEGHSHSEEEGHSHGDEDPHVWQDPLRMAAAAGIIADAVAEATGLDAATLDAQAAAYAAELEALDAELVTAYGAIPAECRKLVTDHDAFGYLADRYEFEIVGTIIPTGAELAEPSAAELSALADAITTGNVSAIFSESIFPSALAEALEREVGNDVALVTLYSDSLGDPGSGADTYITMMRTNAERITGALC